jgi:hypothetical protein
MDDDQKHVKAPERRFHDRHRAFEFLVGCEVARRFMEDPSLIAIARVKLEERLGGISLAPGIVLKPFFQYIFDPDQEGIANPSPTNNHAIFAGGMLAISFPETLGLPRMPKPGT